VGELELQGMEMTTAVEGSGYQVKETRAQDFAQSGEADPAARTCYVRLVIWMRKLNQSGMQDRMECEILEDQGDGRLEC
jgi:hypothetical protein